MEQLREDGLLRQYTNTDGVILTLPLILMRKKLLKLTAITCWKKVVTIVKKSGIRGFFGQKEEKIKYIPHMVTITDPEINIFHNIDEAVLKIKFASKEEYDAIFITDESKFHKDIKDSVDGKKYLFITEANNVVEASWKDK